MKIALVAGEASGDLLGSGLIREIRRLVPDARFEGIAGPRMVGEGARTFYAMESISIMGLDGLFKNLLNILSIRRGLHRRFVQSRPDVFVGIDVPDFNIGLEARLKSAGIPTVHYVSPTVWAWRRYRIRKIRRAVTHMMTLFPFEADFYEEHGVPVTCVGHPLADGISVLSREEARNRLDLPESEAVVAVLPGSRDSEIARLGELFVAAAQKLAEAHPRLHFVIPCARPDLRDRLHLMVRNVLPAGASTLVDGNAQLCLQSADVALLASGTAALEAALVGTPMVVAYRVSALSYAMVKMFSTVDHYSMPNHLLQRPIVPEYLQGEATADNLADAVGQLLEDPKRRQDFRSALAGIRDQLALGADRRAARIVVDVARQRA
jgi:lipid-A-disaccharide synthase